MPWKSSLGRSNGQPARLDCSGNAGIVVVLGLNGCIVSGSGLGKPARRRGTQVSTRRKVRMFRDIGVGKKRSVDSWVCLSEEEECEMNIKKG